MQSIMTLTDASAIEAENDDDERKESGESNNHEVDARSDMQVAKDAATASGEKGMNSKTPPSIGQQCLGTNHPPPTTFYSQFGRPNPLFASAWPFDEVLEESIALGIVTGPLLCANPHHVHFTTENTVGPGDYGDDCRPNDGGFRASLVLFAFWIDTSVGTTQISANNLSSCEDLPEQAQKETFHDCDKLPSASEEPAQVSANDLSSHEHLSEQIRQNALHDCNKRSLPVENPVITPESPSFPASRAAKHPRDVTISDFSPEPVLKKAKLKMTLSPIDNPSKELPQPETKRRLKSGSGAPKAMMNRPEQARAPSPQKSNEEVKTETMNQEMEDVSCNNQASKVTQPSPTLAGTIKPSGLNQAILAADPEENPAKAYAKLTRVGKRSNRAVNPNAEQDQDQAEQGTEGGERRDSKAIHRPFAPTTYARNSGKSRGTRRIVLETRRTHYSAAVYQQFANMPDETKYCSRSDEIMLEGMEDLVKHYIAAVKQGRDAKVPLTELRDRLHQMQFYDFLSKRLIEETKLFELTSLGAILVQKNNYFPWDIQADAHMFAKQVLEYGCDPHLLRGIKVTTSVGKKGKSYALDETYPFRASSNYVGPGNLIIGQWWPRRICALRDGAHGATEAGIHGATGKGAYSIIVGGDSGYHDLDEGEKLQYCGTPSDRKDSYGVSVPTAHTTRMLESCDRTHNEIRVFRAAAASGKYTAFSPSCGLRFDGMYTIIGKEQLHADTSMYRFTLVRCPDQDPIRYKGPEERPTRYEKSEYAKLSLL
ncbi:MAG: hypothetical protein Q9180_005675 [Flavoplaca navasiana]